MLPPARLQSVADISRHHARTQPRATALIYGDRRTDYGALDRNANRVANALIAAGVKPQQRIAQLDKNTDIFFELYYGSCKANAVLVSVNWRLAGPELAYVINDSDAEILFVGEDFFDIVDKIRPQLTKVRSIIAFTGRHGGWDDFATWRDRHPDSDPMVPVTPDDVCVQLYTSGTTGNPKGAQLTHRNLLTLFPIALSQWQCIGPDSINLVILPSFHIGGGGWGFAGLYAGATNIVVREFVPAQVLEIIQRYRVTTTILVPAMILFLLQTPQIKETDLSSLKTIAYGAAPMPLPLLQQAMKVFPCGFIQLYGLTETTGGITYLPAKDHDEARAHLLRSCGIPHKDVEIRILDADGKEVAQGQVGEIVVRTPQIMRGYWKLPEATHKAIRDGWFYSGDAGYFDKDGYLYIHDRVKDMIVSGGENIYPAEVESALFAHPAIADVAVIGVPDEQWGESVKAVVVRKPGATVTAAELIAFARERIAGYKVPKSIDFIDILPRNPTGKLLKRELRKPYWQGRERQVN